MAEGKSKSTKSVAFYPPLVAAFPVLAVFSANTGLFPLHDLYRPLGAAFVGGLALWLACSLLRWSVERGALFSGFLLASVWIGRKCVESFDGSVSLIWPIIGVGGAIGLLLSFRKTLPTQVLNRFALFLVVVSVISIGLKSRGSSPEAASSGKVTTASKPPDIFLLLLDGYGRADQLQRVMGFDNTPFVEKLRKEGFLVLDQNRSNYCQTALSVGSMLNLDFIQKLAPEMKPSDGARDPLIKLVNHPLIVRELRTAGYESIAVSTGFPSFDFEGFDLVISERPPVSYFESVLLDFLPVDLSGRATISQFDTRRHMLTTAFSELRKMATPTSKPRFIFAHILAPHPPFVFDGDKPTPKPQGGFGFFDGSDYMTYSGTPITYTKGYRGQLKWVNDRVEELVTDLLSRPGPKPIILLQGDHGSKRGLDQNEISRTDLNEAMAPLAAYYVPDSIRTRLRPTTTPLNVIRQVAGFATGKKYEFVPDVSYYSPFAKPYDFTDVTNRTR